MLAEYSQKEGIFNIFCAKRQINTICAENIKIICANTHKNLSLRRK